MHSALPTFWSAWGSSELDSRRFAFWHAGDALLLDRPALDEWLLAPRPKQPASPCCETARFEAAGGTTMAGLSTRSSIVRSGR